MAIGKRDGIRPADVVGSIANEANVPGRDIGPIEIREDITFVTVPLHFKDQIIDAVKSARFRGRSVALQVADDQTPSPRPAGKPDYKPRPKPGFKSGDKPGYSSGDKPEYKPRFKPGDKPAYRSGEKPDYKPRFKPGDKPRFKPGDKPGFRPGAKPRSSEGFAPDFKPGFKKKFGSGPKTAGRDSGPAARRGPKRPR